MKFLVVVILVAYASAIVLEPRQQRRKRNRGKAGAGAGAGAGAAAGAAAGGTINAANGQTIVLFEVGGVPGNNCLTFRNNGEIVDVCVGFNGTAFKAVDCADGTNEPAAFAGGELRATGGACANGHDNVAQIIVDPTGGTCATFTSTNVQPAAA